MPLKLVAPLASVLLFTAGCSSSSSTSPAETGGNGSPVSDPVTGDSTGGTAQTTGNSTTGNTTGSSTGGTTGSSNNTPGQPIVLTALPQPPFTSAPNASHEPKIATGPVSSVKSFFLRQDPAGVIPNTDPGPTEEEFTAGLSAAVISIPNGLDTTLNHAPYFEGLNNVEVLAGSYLELRLKPVDVDGGLPGMFPEALPEGAQYIDNFDGTRTLRWRPLQPDVGFTNFRIIAIDPVEPLYRAQQTVWIKVVMPSDPSTIVNLPPGLNRVRPHTVRLGDPVVIEIKGTDPNGTYPELGLINPPPGSTFIQHYNEPAIKILRFFPEAAGEMNIDVVASDAVNGARSKVQSIKITVKDPSEFIYPGTRLRTMAKQRDLLIGYASLKDFYFRPDGGIYAEIARNEFNFVSSENALKWDGLNPSPGLYRWAAADNLVNYADIHGQAVHGHTLVWHRQLPGWVKSSPTADREIHMREFIDRVLTRYKQSVPVWDVVNEAFEEDGTYRNSTWHQAMGPDYIEIAFRQARQSAPNATLLYNEYDVAWDGPKFDGMYKMLQSMKNKLVPLDGVGFQMHLFADFNKFDEVTKNFQAIADLDLDIYITELDVSIQGGQTEQQQADVYEAVLDICLKQPRCKAFQIWGFTDQYSWRRDHRPLIFDNDYKIKPAYLALQRRLSEN
ncbi:MAG: endo-1,4-beta-xylanase [Granulosicoccaceae bacterium]